MATVDEICRDVVGSLALSESYLICARWIDNRYKEIVSKVRFRHLRKIGELEVAATYDIGSASATRGSTAITGNGTSWLTGAGYSISADWYIKPSSSWYEVASVGSETSLTLETRFSEDSVSNVSYKLVKRFHSLNANARWLGDFVLTRLRLPLGNGGQLVPLEQLDREVPGRVLTDQYPRTGSVIGVSSTGAITIELYPYSAQTEIVHYVYWDLPTSLTITSDIPAQIDPYVLKEGVLIDAYRLLKAKARNLGQSDIANSWRNDEFAQATRWKNYMNDAIRTDQSTDDKTFILSMFGGRQTQGDIVSARDQILSNWSYPA